MKIKLLVAISFLIAPVYASDELKDDNDSRKALTMQGDNDLVPKRKKPSKPQSSKGSKHAKAAGPKLLVNGDPDANPEDPTANVDLEQDVPGNVDNYLRGSRMFWIISENIADGLKKLCMSVSPPLIAVSAWSSPTTTTTFNNTSVVNAEEDQNIWWKISFATSTIAGVLELFQTYAAKTKLDREKALAEVIAKHNRLHPQGNAGNSAAPQPQ